MCNLTQRNLTARRDIPLPIDFSLKVTICMIYSPKGKKSFHITFHQKFKKKKTAEKQWKVPLNCSQNNKNFWEFSILWSHFMISEIPSGSRLKPLHDTRDSQQKKPWQLKYRFGSFPVIICMDNEPKLRDPKKLETPDRYSKNTLWTDWFTPVITLCNCRKRRKKPSCPYSGPNASLITPSTEPRFDSSVASNSLKF